MGLVRDQLIAKLKVAANRDPEIISSKINLDTTLGSDAVYLDEVLHLSKSNMIRLERMGLAVKARYASPTGHRVRWIIFEDALK